MIVKERASLPPPEPKRLRTLVRAKGLLIGWGFSILLTATTGLGQESYLKPPTAILDVLQAPATPRVTISPTKDYLLLVEGVRYPSIRDLAQPMLRLAGLRINPETNGPHHPPRLFAFTLKRISDGKETLIKHPADPYHGFPTWSADGKRFAFTNTTPRGIELWIAETATGVARQIEGVQINGISFGYGFGAITSNPFRWMPDNRTLLAQVIPAGRGKPPAGSTEPHGPKVQEGAGKPDPVRTFQDLLLNAHDENLFEYYATAQLALIDTENGRQTTIGKPGLFAKADPSPDGRHLLVARLHRPFSYLHPAGAFPKEVEVWDLQGRMIYRLVSLPLADQVPIDGVPTGPRNYHWKPTAPATLVWVEALDGGDPKQKVPHRDRLRMLASPFRNEPAELAKTEQRLSDLSWTDKDGTALLRDYDRDRRWSRIFLLDANAPASAMRLLRERSMRDRYNDPGMPITHLLSSGHYAILQRGDWIFLSGAGASPEGDRPFLDRFNLKTLQAERLFRSDAKSYETVVALLDNDASRFITQYESPTEPPNYYVRNRTIGDLSARAALTHFVDTTPQLRQIRKERVIYKRDDGVPLSFTLFLPPGYQKGVRLPTVVWAYPLEFNDADTAGQISGSTQRYTTISGPSHLFFLMQGYAILDNAAMPVIGDPETVNNTYLEQVVAGAKAAIDKAVALGVTDPERVGVGGHSYGAFMTANLLAHSNVFRAGIARSGSYNRTLTPFGFQSERRTLWEAPELYMKMSPFIHADKIKTPLLLIHGEADNNSGTFPLQSDRLYHAIRGNGGAVRYVTLPLEAHGYAARESIEHTLYEMLSWFDKHVKNAAARNGAAGSVVRPRHP
ncbi:MAG: S9 family peptidase [Acidobacteria bacterium]|nr:S9 family peptidase [Acidobacteriota bacterium]MBI3658769.1 S9 family peptidase [Acidobacteriota bacterium]